MPPKKRVKNEAKEAAVVSPGEEKKVVIRKERNSAEEEKKSAPNPKSASLQDEKVTVSRNLRPRKTTCYTEHNSPKADHQEDHAEKIVDGDETSKRGPRRRGRRPTAAGNAAKRNATAVADGEGEKTGRKKMFKRDGLNVENSDDEANEDLQVKTENGNEESAQEMKNGESNVNSSVAAAQAAPVSNAAVTKKSARKLKKKPIVLLEKIDLTTVKTESEETSTGNANAEKSDPHQPTPENLDTATEASSSKPKRDEQKSMERVISSIIPSLNNPLLPLPPLPPFPNMMRPGFLSDCFNSGAIIVKQELPPIDMVLKKASRKRRKPAENGEQGANAAADPNNDGFAPRKKKLAKKSDNIALTEEVKIKIEVEDSETAAEAEERKEGAITTAEKMKPKRRLKKKSTAISSEKVNPDLVKAENATVVRIKEENENTTVVSETNAEETETGEAQSLPPINEEEKGEDETAPNLASTTAVEREEDVERVLSSLLPPINASLPPLPPLPPPPIFVRRPGFFRGRRAKALSSRSGRKELIHREEVIDPEDIKGFEHVERYVTPPGVRLSKFWDSEDELSDDDTNDNFRRIMCGFGTNCRLHEVIRPVTEIVRRSKELQSTFGGMRTLPLFPKPFEEKPSGEEPVGHTLLATHNFVEVENESSNPDEAATNVPAIIWHNDPSYFEYANNFP